MRKFTESINDLSPIQLEYDDLVGKVKSAQDELSKYEESIKSKGLYIKDGVVTQDDHVWALFWDIQYYSHFDGHTSDPIYDLYSGACIIDEDKSDMVRELIIHWDTISFDEKLGFLEKICETRGDAQVMIDYVLDQLDEYGESELIKDNVFNRRFQFIIEDTSLRIEMIRREEDQNECCSGSYIEWSQTTKSELNRIKNKRSESRG